jgi:hypothetical protein
MKRERFPINSDQMELLLAFEVAGNLENLADLMAKDQSVISRNLQRLANEIPRAQISTLAAAGCASVDKAVQI